MKYRHHKRQKKELVEHMEQMEEYLAATPAAQGSSAIEGTCDGGGRPAQALLPDPPPAIWSPDTIGFAGAADLLRVGGVSRRGALAAGQDALWAALCDARWPSTGALRAKGHLAGPKDHLMHFRKRHLSERPAGEVRLSVGCLTGSGLASTVCPSL